ncbi:3-isopropylmalate dehydrogenase [Secundilactobacillus folii]|uniref:3-isopropylmalate dehydrogenase n=1 Tax=Secundilactobacillus folii TaxID=2678357 RepID=A0A7X3C1C1_9LACO|nr:3-isopropylmalate dehydrogenase [Secundilactobacillus folii]MTV81570.1 3-isopropylmalate dehydrogenase [Secundilactobacillus folii]
MTAQITVLAGDYIGPEIMAAGLKVLAAVSEGQNFDYQLHEMPFGGAGIDQAGDPLPAEALQTAQKSDAILLAAIGGPKWDGAPKTPEQGLLAIRKALNLFANIRPTEISPAMQKYSPIKNTEPVDFVIVRELTSGIYFGQPRETTSEYALDTMRYTNQEIERITRVAFDMAMKRRKHVTLVDKANVLDTSKLWRKIVAQIATEYPAVTYDTSYVDAASMKIIASPSQFDVILTENLFGDILSDEAAQITGSLGTIPSMSRGSNGPSLYEPIHGSAPDIAGQGIANPISMVKSVAMMLTHSFDRADLAKQISDAVDATVESGVVTPDLGGNATTDEMTSAIINHIKESRHSYEPDHV